MTKSEDIKDLVYYMSLPYTVRLKPDDEGDFIATIEELSGCIAHGSTESEAIERLREAQSLWIEDCLESNDAVPEPEAEDELPSGKWVQRVPRTLHKKLVEMAKREGVSLNQAVTSMLSNAVAGMTLRDHFKTWVEGMMPPIRGHRHGAWADPWGTILRKSKTAGEGGLLVSLEAAKKLIPNHVESNYESNPIAGYKEVEERAKRRR